MSKLKVEVIKINAAGQSYTEDYYFVDPHAAVAFANYQEEHATVINTHGDTVHVSPVVNAEPVSVVAEPVVETIAVEEAVVVVEPVVEETVDTEITADEDTTVKPVKKTRTKKEAK